MQICFRDSIVTSMHYLTLNQVAADLSHWAAKLALELAKYNCLPCGFLDNVSATTCNGSSLYTMVWGNSFNYSNHLASYFVRWGCVYKLNRGL